MSVITIRLQEKQLRDLDNRAHVVHMTRAEYIRCAIEHMNNEVKNRQRKEQLKRASLHVRKESMRINKEFSRIERDPKD